jgi:hypothetical protein
MVCRATEMRIFLFFHKGLATAGKVRSGACVLLDKAEAAPVGNDTMHRAGGNDAAFNAMITQGRTSTRFRVVACRCSAWGLSSSMGWCEGTGGHERSGNSTQGYEPYLAHRFSPDPSSLKSCVCVCGVLIESGGHPQPRTAGT